MSKLELTGKITKINEVVEGVSKSTKKEWKKIGFTVETTGEYPKSVYFSVFGGDRVDNFIKFNKEGDNVLVSFDVESREYKGNYYTDLSAWLVKKLSEGKQEEVSKEESEDAPF